MGWHSTNVILGLVAGATIYIGLLLARWRSLPASFRPVLALLSAGILVYLTIEVGHSSFESVESAFRLGHLKTGFTSLILIIGGLVLGLVALGVWEDRQTARKSGGLNGLELATMTAVGIGVHNFGEGLAIGQSYASGAAALGASLVAGFALHNATEGFGIVGAMRGENATWSRLGLLGLIGGGPTVLGSIIGGVWTNDLLVTFCYALAAGSLLFVVRELLRIPFKIPARVALAAVTCGLVIGLVTETIVESVQAAPQTPAAGAETVRLTISNGHFSPVPFVIPTGANLLILNRDKRTYTLEGPGILRGDVPIDAGGSQTLRTTCDPGAYNIYAEEDPRTMVLPVRVTGDAPSATVGDSVVQTQLAAGHQPILFGDPAPAYSAYTAFNISGKGESAREDVLKTLFEIEKGIAIAPPSEIAQYFTRGGWERLRPSVSMVYGLGPRCYDSARFGPRVASSKPEDMHPIWYSGQLNFDAKRSQKDILVRVASDSEPFNQQMCRYIWRRLAGQIGSDHTLDFGYDTQTGRSPILGGFFDGTGNPIGKERDQAVFGKSGQTNGTYLAWFKIRFDQERFESHPLEEQESIIGRNRKTGLLYHSGPNAHQIKAEGDSTRSILRQGYVFDYGPRETGLLFASVQASLSRQLEGILCGFMMNASMPKPGAGKDRLIDYMHFEEGGYYYIAPVPPSGFPGML